MILAQNQAQQHPTVKSAYPAQVKLWWVRSAKDARGRMLVSVPSGKGYAGVIRRVRSAKRPEGSDAGGFVLPDGPKGAIPWVMAHCITD